MNWTTRSIASLWNREVELLRLPGNVVTLFGIILYIFGVLYSYSFTGFKNISSGLAINSETAAWQATILQQKNLRFA